MAYARKLKVKGVQNVTLSQKTSRLRSANCTSHWNSTSFSDEPPKAKRKTVEKVLLVVMMSVSLLVAFLFFGMIVGFLVLIFWSIVMAETAISEAKAERVPRDCNIHIGKTKDRVFVDFGIPDKEYNVGKYVVVEFATACKSRGLYANRRAITKFYFDNDIVVKCQKYAEA